MEAPPKSNGERDILLPYSDEQIMSKRPIRGYAGLHSMAGTAAASS
jgi:hypothetical protein